MQISCAVTAQLISTFVFVPRLVKFLFYFPKFQVSSFILRFVSDLVINPNCWFSHAQAHIKLTFQLSRKKQDFLEALKRLESNPECQGLPMISFLLLPMQRITRLPLLVDAICHRMDPINDKDRHTSAIKALDALNRVIII